MATKLIVRRAGVIAPLAVFLFVSCGLACSSRSNAPPALPAARVVELHVMSSSGFSTAYRDLLPEFQRAAQTQVTTSYGPSMGQAPDAIPIRIQRGEPVDVVIMAGSALDELIKQGKVLADSRVDLGRSLVGMAVRAGAPRPDITTVEAFKKALLDAKSIAYSDSASGQYVSKELFKRLGIADQVMGKSKEIPSKPVGEVVARGEAEIGFQQVSELLPVDGIQFLGPIPPELQKVTVFSAGVAASSKEPERARALIRWLASREASPVIKKHGLEPVTRQNE